MQTQLNVIQGLLESAVIIDDTAKGEKNKNDEDANPGVTQREHQAADKIPSSGPIVKTGMWKEYAEVLRKVRGSNTLTILLPVEEEQADLKLETGTFTSIFKCPVLKQLAIKRGEGENTALSFACFEAAAPRAEVLADSLVSTSIDQDAPSTSIPSLQEQEHSPIIYQGFEESPKTPTFHDDPLNESPHEDLTYQGSSLNVRQIHTPFEHLGR
nr:hypothetical protein [Tanacetum cinerariifolium]